MVKKRSATVLFFTQDAKPNDAEMALAEQLGSNVRFRNGRIARGVKPEPCDAVAAVKGEFIPVSYAEANVIRVRTAEDVARLKPMFHQTRGYVDDDGVDRGYAGPDASRLPSTENEPGVGTAPGEDAAAAMAALAAAGEGNGEGDTGAGTSTGGTGAGEALKPLDDNDQNGPATRRRGGAPKAPEATPPTPPAPAGGTTPPAPPAWGSGGPTQTGGDGSQT